ncbi:MAG TPA: hypothetical protein VMT10_14175 [Solirubrobacteraceae bacterium]|nr:hypothetical protein [Solirubrobacteraceae bacterium]
MPRRLLTAGALVCALAAIPSIASADVVEIGKLDPNVKSSCPGPVPKCYAFVRATGYQAKVGTNRGLMTVPADGRIVAFTVGLGKPGPKQIDFFTNGTNKFGNPSVQLTILDPKRKLRARAVAQSESFNVQPYFGTVAQFPLTKSVPVKKGQIVAITSTTWAPVLATGLGTDTSWRASRPKGSCSDVATQTAQTQPNELTQYYCLYPTARVNYSATEVTNPVIPTTTPTKTTTKTTTTKTTTTKK